MIWYLYALVSLTYTYQLWSQLALIAFSRISREVRLRTTLNTASSYELAYDRQVFFWRVEHHRLKFACFFFTLSRFVYVKAFEIVCVVQLFHKLRNKNKVYHKKVGDHSVPNSLNRQVFYILWVLKYYLNLILTRLLHLIRLNIIEYVSISIFKKDSQRNLGLFSRGSKISLMLPA